MNKNALKLYLTKTSVHIGLVTYLPAFVLKFT